jgi:hypothetical protein
MKMLCTLAAVFLIGVATSFAHEAKTVTIKGEGLCAHCDLSKGGKCSPLIKVTGEDGKAQTYKVAKNSVSKAAKLYHYKKVEATGTLVEKDGEFILTATKITKQ